MIQISWKYRQMHIMCRICMTTGLIYTMWMYFLDNKTIVRTYLIVFARVKSNFSRRSTVIVVFFIFVMVLFAREYRYKCVFSLANTVYFLVVLSFGEYFWVLLIVWLQCPQLIKTKQNKQTYISSCKYIQTKLFASMLTYLWELV